MESDDDTIIYGTPLQPLEDGESAGKKPELDLTVRDWKGRRRFHGAFTGGFSAGYFNTVGTEKGWIPSQFVSKKEQRWDKNLVKNKPEDYMDDEDFSLFGIAPKKVHTKDKFKGPEPDVFAGLRNPNASLVDVLREIIKPANLSIGVRLYQAMKRGKRYKGAVILNKPTSKKIYGCSLPPEFSQTTSADEENNYEDSFIRPDTFSLPYTPKNDFHGIGYKPLASTLIAEKEQSAPLTAVLTGNKRLKITGEAFGYGALEDEDDDFADEAQIYSKEDLSNYDFEIGAVRRKEPSKSSSISALPYQTDGLEGFVKAKTIQPFRSDSSNLPVIPKNWKPCPPFLKNKKKVSRWDLKNFKEENLKKAESSTPSSTFSHPTSAVKLSHQPSILNANVRSIILGEEIEIVSGIKKKSELEKSQPDTEEKTAKTSEPSIIPSTSRPLSAFFASKFTRSSELLEENLVPGLVESRAIDPVNKKTEEKNEEIKSSVGLTNRETLQWHPHTLLSKRFNVPHPYPQYPDVVGVVAGFASKTLPAQKKNFMDTKPNLFSSLFESQTEFSSKIPQSVDQIELPKDSLSHPSNPIIELESDDKITENVDQRPPMDLFKAIFASDESESDQEDDETNKKAESITKKTESNLQTSQTNINTNVEEVILLAKKSNNKSVDSTQSNKPSTSKGGIFSGIDLDLLNKPISYKIKSDQSESRNISDACDKNNELQTQNDKMDEIEDSYGPALPPPTSSSNYSHINSDSDSSDDERRKSKRKKKKDKKHKSKKSKKKMKR